MSAININKNNFQNEIMDSEKTVLLDFWAPWCAPCRMVVPVIEEIAGERPDIKVGKINVDEQPELASKFSIMSIPTLVVMKNGKIVQQVSGARPKKAILEMLNEERWKNKMKVIIVGGVAGGATAAARIRRLDEHAEITVFERSGYISYANCGLPYYIGDVITDPEELTLQTPESFFKRFHINMKIYHEVISIHPDRRTVSVKNLENGEIFEENYDKLILSPGAKPTQPRLPGVGIDKLFTLRTVEDTFRIKEYINKNHPKSAILAGGGFIGLELAENLRELGMDVTIVQRPKQLMNPFDPDMASMIHNEMRKHGIKLVLGYTVEGFREKDNGVEILLKDNPSLQADMVVLAIGVYTRHSISKRSRSGAWHQGKYRSE